jgi:signal transduction histidine kinase
VDEPARIAVHGRAPALPPLVGAHAYRIGCEAIVNALRHAEARTIDVTFCTEPGVLRVTVVDDGRGLPEHVRAGAIGLHAMESRALTIGGRLHVGAGPGGHGTRVELDVPLNPNGGPP